jgi:hypothetical protein
MHELNSNYKYFFKYLRVGNDVDINWLKQLFNQEEIRYFWQEHPSFLAWITFKQIVQYKKFYFGRYDKLNDPFECIANIAYTQSISDEIIEKYYNSIPHNNLKLEDLKKEINFYIHEKRSVYWPIIQMPFGIYSLNTNPENIQMWSHYANNHQGICIVFTIDWDYIISQIGLTNPQINSEIIVSILLNEGFRFSITSPYGESIRFGLQKVRYNDSVITYPASKFMQAHFDENEKEEFAWTIAQTKHITWQYEDEWRIVCFNQYSDAPDQLISLTMPPSNFIKPCGIILGIKMIPEIKELIKAHYEGTYPIIEATTLLNEKMSISYSITPNKIRVIEELSSYIKTSEKEIAL